MSNHTSPRDLPIGLGGSAAFAVTALFVMRFAVGIAEAPAFPANPETVDAMRALADALPAQ